MKLLQFTWLRIKHTPFRYQPPPVAAGPANSHRFWILHSCFLYRHKTPNINTATQFLFISLLLLSWALERDFLKALLWRTYYTKSNDHAAVVYEQIDLLFFFPFYSFLMFFDLLKNCLREKKQTLLPPPPHKKSQLWECLLFLAALIFIPYLIGILPC